MQTSLHLTVVQTLKARLSSRQFSKRLHASLLALGAIALPLCYAAQAKASGGTWSTLYSWVEGLFTGTPGVLLSLAALGAGIMGAFASSHKGKSLAFAILIPIAIQVGPSIVTTISGAVL